MTITSATVIFLLPTLLILVTWILIGRGHARHYATTMVPVYFATAAALSLVEKSMHPPLLSC
jgi:hypothetical protein